MSMNERSIVEEALLQIKAVENAISENAKGILASTMKEEISQLVKESLSEQEDEIEMDADVEMGDIDTDADNDEMDLDLDDEDEMDIDMDMDFDDEEETIDLTNASDEEILKIFFAPPKILMRAWSIPVDRVCLIKLARYLRMSRSKSVYPALHLSTKAPVRRRGGG